MQNQDEKINYDKRPVPSSPGAQQITTVGQDSMKGGSEFVSKLPTEYVIPEGKITATAKGK